MWLLAAMQRVVDLAADGEGDTDPAFTALRRARAVRSWDDTAGYLADVAPA